MRKIISLFQRNYGGDHLVRNEVVPGAEWVIAGEGVATKKYDGTCCMVRGGQLYKRFDCKAGKTPPHDFEPSQDADPVTGHRPGWVPVDAAKPEDKWHLEALVAHGYTPEDGTYELCGPKVQGNPEVYDTHALVPHATHLTKLFEQPPRDFAGIRAYLERYDDMEGIVWHHPDGRMVKIKAKDFGLKRRAPSAVSAK